jgi:fused signal recognition particle receptor
MLGFLKKVTDKITGRTADWDSLEPELIRADFGPVFTAKFIETLRGRQGVWSSKDVATVARQAIADAFPDPVRSAPDMGKPIHVIVLVGVNGTGKTTTAAKLAHYHAAAGRRVRMVAGDTFRAAAIEQLQHWGAKLGVPVSSGKYGADAAGLAFGAYEEALREGSQVLIVDTAGRQHTKGNLMQELVKVFRVLAKHGKEIPHETLLVLDASTGSNALVQAREFSKHIPISGVVATKMDGSGTGGALVAIRQELRLPPLWVGTGETLDTLARFDAEAYAQKLLGND